MMDVIYLEDTEKIGIPDPLSPNYVGTYSPPRLYFMATNIEPLALDISVTSINAVMPFTLSTK